MYMIVLLTLMFTTPNSIVIIMVGIKVFGVGLCQDPL